MMNNIITLTTDFGLTDEYVGVIKGVILSKAPLAKIVDLSHGIDPGDIGRATGILKASCHYFPAGTVHVAVVDPGVGTERRVILAAAHGQLFLAPDNGLLPPLLTADPGATAHAVTNRELFLQPVSSTFHGRDIFAPVAAELALGLPPEKAGEPVPLPELADFSRPPLKIDHRARRLIGRVDGIDHFGNLLTNITAADIEHLPAAAHDLLITTKGRTIQGLSPAYGTAPAGRLLAVIGSRGSLEIAANQKNAAKKLNAQIGEPVIVAWGK